MEKISVKNTLKFILGTLAGLFLVVIPLQFDGSVDTFTFYYLKKFVVFGGQELVTVITLVIAASAVLAVVDTIFHTAWIKNHTLATQLSIIIPPMLLFQTFILEFGFMEFFVTLVGFIVKPLFKVSELTAVSLISAWVGPGNAAIMGARQMFDEGYYTLKEAIIIGTTFSTSSIGWVVLVANVLDLMDKFGTITLVGIIVALIGVRIPPISRYQDVYAENTERKDIKVATNTSRVTQAFILAGNRAEQAGIQNFKAKIKNMLTYVVCLQPIIICWGTVALIISMYTPVLRWISYLIGFFMNITGVPEAFAAAPAILSGFADNYLPIILGKAFASAQIKFIIATMSILQIIFMSEIGALLSSTKLVTKFVDIVLIFIERTIIALPFVILISHMIF